MSAEADILIARLEQNSVSACKILLQELGRNLNNKGTEGLPDAVQKCLSDADVFYILLSHDDAGDLGVASSLNVCATTGKKIVAIVEGSLPSEVDDLADVVFVPGSLNSPRAATAEVSSDHPDRAGKVREIKRIKCQ
jgi:hypothetical protein